MDPISVGALIAGAKAGLDVIRQAADTVTAIRAAAAKGEDGHAIAEVDPGQLGDLAANLVVARIRTMDVLTLAEQLQAENLELRQNLARREAFARRARNYQLKRYEDGAVTYEYVGVVQDGTPPHSFCSFCFVFVLFCSLLLVLVVF